MVNLVFYFKEGCWLCDHAEELVNGQKERYDIRIKKVAIDSDEALYELYRFDIPVFEFKDGSTLHGRIRKKDLLRKIEENKELDTPPLPPPSRGGGEGEGGKDIPCNGNNKLQ